MYKVKDNQQPSFLDFEQPLGMHLNPDNRWIRLAAIIPWDKYESRYASKFKSATGNVAKPFRMALGALIIQKKLGVSDRELVQEICENPYLQYFIGLPGYQEEEPFDPSAMVAFRKRISLDMATLLNDAVLDDAEARIQKDEREKAFREARKQQRKKKDHDHHDNNSQGGGSSGRKETNGNSSSPSSSAEPDTEKDEDTQPANAGTLILDATCAPSDIRFPQDFSLLNEARENLERIIRRICRDNNERMPRTYRIEARKNYLGLAKCRRKSSGKIRKVIRKQLGYILRDIGYIDSYIGRGFTLNQKEMNRLETIRKVYSQQKEMFDKHNHHVADRIVSLSQPYIRPIIRGKAKAPVEFGIKFDLSIDECRLGRIEKITFDAYNEQETLQKAVESYRQRTGHYPERVLADQIYRNKANRRYCAEHGIRMSGPKLGRPSAHPSPEERHTAYQDNTDRIEIERSFSLSKRCYGLGLIRTRLEETSYGAVGLSILVTNLFRILDRYCLLFFTFFKELASSASVRWKFGYTGFRMELSLM